MNKVNYHFSCILQIFGGLLSTFKERKELKNKNTVAGEYNLFDRIRV